MKGNKPTHVLLGIDEYERLRRAVVIQEIESDTVEAGGPSIDARDAAMQIAGGWIAAARKKAGLTQTQLARKVGVPQSMISRIERNPDRTTVRTIKRIAKALNVDVAALASFVNR